MSALTWTTLQTTLLAILVKAQPPYNVVPPDFAQLYPRATSYAESRICQEIPLLGQSAEDSSQVTVAGSRTISVSGMTTPIVVPETLDLITPSGFAVGAGARWAFDRTTIEAINSFWPVQAVTLAPGLAENTGRFFALLSAAPLTGAPNIVIAPTPDLSGYRVAVTGLAVPSPLSPSNQSNYLSTTYPDLLTAACMVFLEGALLHNYGAQGDDPRSALSWEGEYMKLRDAAEYEEMRRRGLLSDQPPRPQAAPPAGARA